jgi:hypothetical protein
LALRALRALRLRTFLLSAALLGLLGSLTCSLLERLQAARQPACAVERVRHLVWVVAVLTERSLGFAQPNLLRSASMPLVISASAACCVSGGALRFMIAFE